MVQIKLIKNWRSDRRGEIITVNEVVADALVKQDFGLLVLPEKQIQAGQDRPVVLTEEAPIEPINKVRKVQKIPKYLSVEEVKKLINQPYLEGIKYKEELKNKRRSKGQVWLKRIQNKLFAGKRDYAILHLFYSSGIRLAELVGLDLGDIDFDRGIVKVLGKGSREREATLTTEAIKVLQGYLKARKNWKGCKGEAVFLSRGGKRITRINIQRNIVRYGKLAGTTKKVMPHMLRHSIATHYLNGGMDIRKVQDFLGHESLASTQVYTHLITDDQREERNRLHPLNKFGLKAI